MKHNIRIVLPLLSLAIIGSANAQSLSPAWESYRNKQRTSTATSEPVTQTQTQTQTQTTTPSPSTTAQWTPPPQAPAPTQLAYQPRRVELDKVAMGGGFFLGAQAGTGWVWEDVEQSAVMGSLGYRWNTGRIASVGLEIGGGTLASATEDGYRFPKIRFGTVGANARINFGPGSRWHALARLGHWAADTTVDDDYDDADVDGVYVGAGVGVDLSRNVSLNLQYTTYVYASTYYYNWNYRETSVNRADVVAFGLEARF